jgi:hypothetical protein
MSAVQTGVCPMCQSGPVVPVQSDGVRTGLAQMWCLGFPMFPMFLYITAEAGFRCLGPRPVGKGREERWVWRPAACVHVCMSMCRQCSALC